MFGCSRYKTHQNTFLSSSGLKCLSNRRHSEVFSAQCVTLKLNWTDEELTHQDVGAGSVWRSGRGLWTVGVVLNHEEHFSVEPEEGEKETPTSPSVSPPTFTRTQTLSVHQQPTDPVHLLLTRTEQWRAERVRALTDIQGLFQMISSFRRDDAACSSLVSAQLCYL